VLELIEGETLAERLAHGPMRFSDAMAIARQLVEALDAAHGKGRTSTPRIRRRSR